MKRALILQKKKSHLPAEVKIIIVTRFNAFEISNNI